jgi:hypothetical protein
MAKSTSAFRVAFRKARKKCRIPHTGTWQEWWRFLNWVSDDSLLRLGLPPVMWRSYRPVKQIESLSAGLFDAIPGTDVDRLSSTKAKEVDRIFEKILQNPPALLEYLPEEIEKEDLIRGVSRTHSIMDEIIQQLLEEDPHLPEILGLPSSWRKLTLRELVARTENYLIALLEGRKVNEDDPDLILVRKQVVGEHHSLFLPVERDGETYMTAVPKEIVFKHDLLRKVTKEEFRHLPDEEMWTQVIKQTPYLDPKGGSWDLPEVEITERSFPVDEWEKVGKKAGGLIASHLCGFFNGMVSAPIDQIPKSLWEEIPTEVQAHLLDENVPEEDRADLLASIREMRMLRCKSQGIDKIGLDDQGFVYPFSWKMVAHVVDASFKEFATEIEMISSRLETNRTVLKSLPSEGASADRFRDLALLILDTYERIDAGDISEFYSTKRGWVFSGVLKTVIAELKALTESCQSASEYVGVIRLLREMRETGQEQGVEAVPTVSLMFDFLHVALSFQMGLEEFVCGMKDEELLSRPLYRNATPFYIRLVEMSKIFPFLLHMDEYGEGIHRIFESKMNLCYEFPAENWPELPNEYLVYASELLTEKPDLPNPIEALVHIEDCDIERLIFSNGPDDSTVFLRVDVGAESTFYTLRRGADWHLTNLLDRTLVNNEWVLVLALALLYDFQHNLQHPVVTRCLPTTQIDLDERSRACQEGHFESALDLFFDLKKD